MARVVALIPDLLFGSNVVGALQAAGHEVRLASGSEGAALGSADVLVVDLTDDVERRLELARGLEVPRKLAFYSHVEAEIRARAEQEGFDLVVPRSRMAREGAALVSRLVSD